MNNQVPAVNFIGTVLANVDNERLSDADFRQFIRNTLPIVEKQDIEKVPNPEIKSLIQKYYK